MTTASKQEEQTGVWWVGPRGKAQTNLFFVSEYSYTLVDLSSILQGNQDEGKGNNTQTEESKKKKKVIMYI